MSRLKVRIVVVRLEGARGDEQVAVEVLAQGFEEAFQRLGIPRLQQRLEVVGAAVRGVPEVLRADNPAVFEIGDEHRLDEQRLRRIGRQIGFAQPPVRLREIAEKHSIHARFRIEIVGVLLPEAARFGAVEEVAERQRVGGRVQCLNQAVGDGVFGAGTWDSSQREDADRVAGYDEEQTGETLVPERSVDTCDARQVVLVYGEDHDGRDVLNAEDGRCAQDIESRAQRAGMRHVVDVIRFLVELRRVAAGDAEQSFPSRFKRARCHAAHHSRPGPSAVSCPCRGAVESAVPNQRNSRGSKACSSPSRRHHSTAKKRRKRSIDLLGLGTSQDHAPVAVWGMVRRRSTRFRRVERKAGRLPGFARRQGRRAARAVNPRRGPLLR